MKVIVINIKDFKKELEAHDWYYMMSDDPRVYEMGKHEDSRLRNLANQDPKLKEVYEEVRNRLFKL